MPSNNRPGLTVDQNLLRYMASLGHSEFKTTINLFLFKCRKIFPKSPINNSPASSLKPKRDEHYLNQWGPSFTTPLQWRHNEHDSVSNHQPHDCLLNRLFGRRSKKTSKLRVTGLCAGNSPGTGEFLAQKSSNAENVSIWWRHHAYVHP